MIHKNFERQRAIELRKNGFSYNDILKELRVSKSSLSLWLRKVGLAKHHERILSERQRVSRENGVKAWHQMRVDKTLAIKKRAFDDVKNINHRELWLIGIALYWAEGSKERGKPQRVDFCNSDPHMILLFKKWLIECVGINQDSLVYTLHIHERAQNLIKAQEYWANFVGIEIEDLRITYKKHNPSPKRKNVGVKYYGLVRITVRRSIDLNRKIAGWIDGLICSTKSIGD